MRKWKAWAVVDRRGTYVTTVHMTRLDAKLEKPRREQYTDAQFVIVPVEVREIKVKKKKLSTPGKG